MTTKENKKSNRRSTKFSLKPIYKFFTSFKQPIEKIRSTFSSSTSKGSQVEQEEAVKVNTFNILGDSNDSDYWDSASVLANRRANEESKGDSFSDFFFTNPNLDDNGNWIGEEEFF